MPNTIDDLLTVSARIRATRKNLAMSQKALAKLAGMSQSTVARVESDIVDLNPSYKTIYEITEALSNYAAGGAQKGGLLGKRAHEIMHRNLVSISPNDSAEKAMTIMKSNDYSQLAVFTKSKKVIGTITQKKLLEASTQHPDMRRVKVRDLLEAALPQVDKDTPLAKIKSMLENWDAVLVVEDGKIVGVITIYDVFRLLG